MKRWKVWACVVALFASGFFIGSAGTALYIRHAVGKFLAGGPPEIRKAVVRRLRWELKLTDAQRAEAEKVVQATQEKLIRVRLRTEPVIDAILREGAEEMKPFLRSVQREKLDKMIETARSRWMLSERHPEYAAPQP